MRYIVYGLAIFAAHKGSDQRLVPFSAVNRKGGCRDPESRGAWGETGVRGHGAKTETQSNRMWFLPPPTSGGLSIWRKQAALSHKGAAHKPNNRIGNGALIEGQNAHH